MGKGNGNERPARFGTLGNWAKVRAPWTWLDHPDLPDRWKLLLLLSWHMDERGQWTISQDDLACELAWGKGRLRRVAGELEADGSIKRSVGSRMKGVRPATRWEVVVEVADRQRSGRKARSEPLRSAARHGSGPSIELTHQLTQNRPEEAVRSAKAKPSSERKGTQGKAKTTHLLLDAWGWAARVGMSREDVRAATVGNDRADAIAALTERYGDGDRRAAPRHLAVLVDDARREAVVRGDAAEQT